MTPWLLEIAGLIAVVACSIYFGWVQGLWRAALSLVIGVVGYCVTWMVWFIAVILAAEVVFPIFGLSFWDRTVTTKVDFWFVHLAGSLVSCVFAIFISRQASGSVDRRPAIQTEEFEGQRIA